MLSDEAQQFQNRISNKSGHGQNFIGERNYFVIPMWLYKNAINELKGNYHVGVIVPIPKGSNEIAEFENPTSLDADTEWELKIIKPSHAQDRKYSLAELMFCMLRSGQS